MSLSRNQVAQLLLKREDANPNLCENGERTPLIQAAICGHEETVRILLARKHAYSNIADNARHTAVAHSWQAGKAPVWRLQSKLQAANPNPPLYTQRAGGNASGVGGIVSGGDSWVGGVVWSIGDNYRQITKKHGRRDQKCIGGKIYSLT